MSDDHVHRLRAVPMFSELPDDALARVVDCATEVEIEAGHVLIQPGQEGAGMFVLLDGTAAVELPGSTLECGPGEFLGELSMLVPGVLHTARVRATTSVRCLAISRADFERLLAEEPRVAVGMLPVLARRLAETDRLLGKS
ncbi:MAG TPA: cyclic nucleotide-binding domain-containing protein [Acidimicrobiia bacterium]|nr:cyclic nucleotide-binding domain-containing protein [Acidimicrobiia bacterium]